MDVKDVPSFGELRSLADLAKTMGVGVNTLHRWRQEPDGPLESWLVGRHWYSTEAALRDFIRSRTAAARAGGQSGPAPVYTAKRRREIDQAVEKCKAMGC